MSIDFPNPRSVFTPKVPDSIENGVLKNYLQDMVQHIDRVYSKGFDNVDAIRDGIDAYGEIYTKDNADTTTLNSAAKVQITDFDANGQSSNMTPDHTNDRITISKDGKYLVTISVAVKNSAGASHQIHIELYKNNGATAFDNVHGHRNLAAGTDVGSITLSGIISVSKDDTIELWADTDSGTDKDVTFQDVTVSIIQVGT